MAVDPRNRPPRLWELWYPALVREGGASASRARRMAHTRLAQIRRTSPRLLDAHPMHEEAPEECAWMMWHNHTIAIRHLSYRYWEWFAGLNHQQTVVLYEAYVAHACRIMADGASAGRRWLGKGQAHVHYLPALLTCVPDARVICLHRDPGKMLPSLLSLYSTVLASPEVSPDYPRIADLLVQMFEHGAGMMMATDSRLDGRIMDIEFDELIADPHDVLRRIYERFSMEWSAELEAAVRRFMAERADDHRSRGSSVAVPWPATCRLRGEVFQRYSDWRAERRRQ
jgi:hypothetical protein